MFKAIPIVIAYAITLCPAHICKGQETNLTLDQIVQKHIEAYGGADKINAVQTMKATGTASLSGGQIEAPLILLSKRPNSTRLELSVRGKSFIQAFDGTTAWMANPFTGPGEPQKMNDEDTKSMKEDSDFVVGPIFDYKSKGSKLELMGKEDVEGSSAYKIKVTRKSGNVVYVYVDAQTFLTAKTSGNRKQMGQELEIETSFGSYKTVNGIMMPFSVEQKNAGKSMTRFTIEKMEMNVSPDVSVFQMPEKPKDDSPEKAAK